MSELEITRFALRRFSCSITAIVTSIKSRTLNLLHHLRKRHNASALRYPAKVQMQAMPLAFLSFKFYGQLRHFHITISSFEKWPVIAVVFDFTRFEESGRRIVISEILRLAEPEL